MKIHYTLEMSKNKLHHFFICGLFFVLQIFVLQISAWTAGTLEEKYHIVLDRRDTSFERTLEKSFFDYARKNKANLILYSVDDYNIANKTDVINSGANNLYPVLIFSRYDKKLLQATEDVFFKKGESGLDGNMGSFIFINEPENHKEDFAFRLPWHSIAFDTTQMSVEMLIALGQKVSKERIDDLRSMSARALYNYTPQKSVATETVLLIINAFSAEEHNLYTAILKKLQILNTNKSIQFLPIYMNSKIQEKNRCDW